MGMTDPAVPTRENGHRQGPRVRLATHPSDARETRAGLDAIGYRL